MTYSVTVMDNRSELSSTNDAMVYGRVAAAADCPALRIPAYERPLCPSPATASALGVDALVNSPASPVHKYARQNLNPANAVKYFS